MKTFTLQYFLKGHWLGVIALLLMAMSAHADQRIALLIGNANYSTGALRNPPNDVKEMEGALRATGFKVQTVLNANQNQMKRAVRDFGSLAQGADIAFLYYSGHGIQAAGENYLIPVQAAIEKEADYEVEAVSANALMRQITNAHPKVAVVVLDACRDNPYASATKSMSKGLSRMDAPTGTMIAFATAPNNTASDEGIYAKVLAKQIRTPGLELLDVFRNTSGEVKRLSGGKQEPRVSEVSISDRVYLLGSASSAPGRLANPGVQVASVKPESASPTTDRPSAQTPSKPAANQEDNYPNDFYLQIGAFRSVEEAETLRSKLKLAGIETSASERSQSGRTIYRVRSGPHSRDESSEMNKKLGKLGFESVLVRVQK